MAKLFVVSLCLVLCAAEPPSSYLPPQARNSLSGQYGPPSPQRSQGFGGRSSGGSHSYNSIAENQFGGSSRSSSRASSRFPTNNFDDFAAPRFGQNRNTNQDFGASRSFGQARQPSGLSAPSPAYRQQPASQYNAPATRYQQPASSYAAAARQQPSSVYGAPSTQYGAPFARNNMDDDLAEPANYEYNYEVQAAEESGAEFGHQETREDDRARGEYHVLLPDGRMQIVEYEADEEGFRPKIRYEETGYHDARNNQGPY